MKGQITIYMMLGVVLLIVAAFVIYLNQLPPLSSRIPASNDAIKSYLQTCVEETGRTALYVYGLSGGAMDDTVAAYVLNGIDNMRDKKFFEQRYADVVALSVKQCVEELKAYSPMVGEVKATALFDDEVVLTVKMPVTVTLTKDIEITDEFVATYPVRVGVYHSLASDVVSQPLGMIPYSTLLKYDVKTDAMLLQDDAGVLYKITDEKSSLFGKPYIFQFAITWPAGSNPLG